MSLEVAILLCVLSYLAVALALGVIVGTILRASAPENEEEATSDDR